MREIKVDFSQNESYECGAALVCALAYPDFDKKEQIVANLHRSLCYLVLQAQAEQDPDWATEPQRLKPIYAFVDKREVAKDLRGLQRRLRDRMAAARMAMAFLKEVVDKKVPKLPTGIRHLSLNELSPMVLSDTNSNDETNVESRVWRPSVPVIHLATATALAMNIIKKVTKREATIGDVLINRDTIRWIIKAADEHAQLITNSKRIKISLNQLVQVRLIE